MAEYEIFDISHVEQIDFEQMGTKSKFWYKNDIGELYLFKATLSTDGDGNAIQRPGEDWAEKIACEISNALSIPSAQYDLAVFKGQAGVITKNFVENTENLLLGNTLLVYLTNIFDEKVTNPNHTHQIPMIVACLEDYVINKPKGWDSLPLIKSAVDVFSGYLMLDALISNQDRHNENWGMIHGKKNRGFLAPSFDHGASLGRNENDAKRQLILTTKDKGQSIIKYVSRAKSQILDENLKRKKTVDAFSSFAGLSTIDASLSWIRQLKGIDNEVFKSIISRVPSSIMSDISKQFAFQIIVENKTRILELESMLSYIQDYQLFDE